VLLAEVDVAVLQQVFTGIPTQYLQIPTGRRSQAVAWTAAGQAVAPHRQTPAT
jgi:hypothetical protein